MIRPVMRNSEIRNRLNTVLDGKYRLEDVVGTGGMGAVYQATHLTLHRKVAIKLLHANYATDHRAISRFNQEARAAASIGHDNICEVTDIGVQENGSPYLVMPLLEGCPLSKLIRREPLFLDRLVDILCQTLAALDAAHRAHIVHRDLKPDNIFITQMGDRKDFVKLLDFGISKMLDSETITGATETQSVLGTPHYMAPEQAGGKQVDHRADIYAAGVILYELLVGKVPFNGKSHADIIYNIFTAPFPTPRSIKPSISPYVEAVVLKAMSRDPMQRFESAEAMRGTLKLAASLDPPEEESDRQTVADETLDSEPQVGVPTKLFKGKKQR